MSARIPTQYKSPFEIDTRPLDEMSSPHAGLLATSRAFRSLAIPGLIDAHLQIKQRQRGFDEAQYIESVVLLQTAGGDCPEDMQLLGGDTCLERGLGFKLPKGLRVNNVCTPNCHGVEVSSSSHRGIGRARG
jgi:hypothetical protein